jgi:hypothetical protein
MKRKKQKEWALELVLALAAAGATAFLLALIARYDMGMSNATIRTGALYAAGAVFAALAGGALINRK